MAQHKTQRKANKRARHQQTLAERETDQRIEGEEYGSAANVEERIGLARGHTGTTEPGEVPTGFLTVPHNGGCVFLALNLYFKRLIFLKHGGETVYCRWAYGWVSCLGWSRDRPSQRVPYRDCK